jgi:hypothetical protein
VIAAVKTFDHWCWLFRALMPTGKSFDRWYKRLLALNRRAETTGFLGCAALAAAPIRALGTSQSLMPLA